MTTSVVPKHWWGRRTTGQSVSLDYIIQRLGAEYAAWALDEK